MLNKNRLHEALEQYKQDFVSGRWDKEKYKWEAVKCFQNHWDIDAKNFNSMLHDSLDKTDNLLTSANHFPRKMIESLAKIAPYEVRSMFIALFDERKDLNARINAFKVKSTELFEKYRHGNGQHYQDENAICTYLWLRFPDKYYIYKFSEAETVAEKLESDYEFKKGSYADNIRNFMRLYDEIAEELKTDDDLVNIFQSCLTDNCYSDSELRTLTVDFAFYVSRNYSSEDDSPWYWWLNANPKQWSLPDLSVGKERYYSLYNDNDNPRRVFQNFIDARIGDPVIGYQSTPVKKVLSILRVSREQDGENIYFEKVKDLKHPIDLETLRSCPELENMEVFKNPQGSLFKLTDEEYKCIINLINGEYEERKNDFVDDNSYTKQDFLKEVYMTESKYNSLVGVLKNKKNIILQGAPGVGKTFCARRLAWSMMGKRDDERIEFIQFHQNYSYEDFIMGYKPVEDGFELKKGIFYRFCKKAAEQPDKDFFFIIDEINRGNMSKIFGELLMSIEKDYRGATVTLAYNGEPFSVPENLYIIGMMNTADRSLAMIDYALRRRFSFVSMEPGFDSEGFTRYQKKLKNKTLDRLIDCVKELNHEIAQDKSLGKGFCIGHSYFCGKHACTDEWLHSIVDYDIIPMLSEYWFDDPNKLQRWESILQGVFQ